MSQREKQRNPVCCRKSSNSKLKQACCPPLPGRPAKLALLCAKRTGKNRRADRKNKQVCFSADLRFFLCPEARVATCKLQAQIVCYRVQAGSPSGFFAAFFPGKKARILPVQLLFADFIINCCQAARPLLFHENCFQPIAVRIICRSRSSLRSTSSSSAICARVRTRLCSG